MTPVPPSPQFRAPIGTSDFRELRTNGLSYVDKTDFVAGVVTATVKVLLFPRPRRFGKTLNLSTLRYFVEKAHGPGENARPLFAGLAIEQRPEAWAHFQRYPVVFMTFKDVRADTYALAFRLLRQEIAAAYRRHRYLLDSEALDEQEKRHFVRILEEEDGDDGEALYQRSLLALSGYLYQHHGEQVAVLIDEYDTPVHAGFASGYYDAIVQFFRGFLSGGLKDNPALWKGMLTGILRVAKEGIFSGLNNLSVYSIVRPEHATAFGFTPAEVARLALDAGAEEALPRMKRWYDGYNFAGEVIYNPWSVICFLASRDRVLRPHWVSTGSMDLVRDQLVSYAVRDKGEIETLLRGKSIPRTLDENIALRDLPPGGEALWGFLFFTGYLTARRVRHKEGLLEVRLAIPNREVRYAYRTLFQTWLAQTLGDGESVRALGRALLDGDATKAEPLLQDLLLRALSFHDTGAGSGAPERVYHAFLLGLLVWLAPRFRVTSNREAGHGRCDILIAPRHAGQPGVVMELKTVDKARRETPARAMAAALRQLRARDYAAELRAAGASPVREIGVVFDGKRVKVAVGVDRGLNERGTVNRRPGTSAR